MQAIPTSLSGVLLLKPQVYCDHRGLFYESYNQRTAAALGIDQRFVQDNHSHSHKNVLRGLHCQIRQPQGKLVRAVAGEVFDVCVDIRPGSSTFGQWTAERLSAENKHMLWIPPGFAHGFLVLSDWADVEYKVTDFCAPQYERTILWNDPDIGIEWPLQGTPVLSEKDKSGFPLRELEPEIAATANIR